MNEYEGWTMYCSNNGCPLQISVVADGDSVPETEVDFAAQVQEHPLNLSLSIGSRCASGAQSWIFVKSTKMIHFNALH